MVLIKTQLQIYLKGTQFYVSKSFLSSIYVHDTTIPLDIPTNNLKNQENTIKKKTNTDDIFQLIKQ